MNYIQIATGTLGLNSQWNNLLACLLLSDEKGTKSIGLGIYYDPSKSPDLTLENYSFGRSPYCNVIWDWKQLDHNQEINTELVDSLFKEANSVFYPQLSIAWKNTLFLVAHRLTSGFVPSETSKNIPQGLENIAYAMQFDFVMKNERNGNPIANIIYSRLVNAWSFEIPRSRYMSKLINKKTDEYIEINFDYTPQGLLSGIAGIEFPVWKSYFRIRESGLYKITRNGSEYGEEFISLAIENRGK